MGSGGKRGFEDLCLEMLLHIAPLTRFMYPLLGYFCSCRAGKPESEAERPRNSSCRIGLN